MHGEQEHTQVIGAGKTHEMLDRKQKAQENTMTAGQIDTQIVEQGSESR